MSLEAFIILPFVYLTLQIGISVCKIINYFPTGQYLTH